MAENLDTERRRIDATESADPVPHELKALREMLARSAETAAVPALPSTTDTTMQGEGEGRR